MRFETFKPTTDIYKPGVLTSLMDDIYAGKPVNQLKRLTPDDFAQLPAIYGCLEPNNLDITSIDVNTDEAGAFTLDVYTLVGTSVGNETNAGAWGAADTSGSGTAAGVNNPSNAVLNTPITPILSQIRHFRTGNTTILC